MRSDLNTPFNRANGDISFTYTSALRRAVNAEILDCATCPSLSVFLANYCLSAKLTIGTLPFTDFHFKQLLHMSPSYYQLYTVILVLTDTDVQGWPKRTILKSVTR